MPPELAAQRAPWQAPPMVGEQRESMHQCYSSARFQATFSDSDMLPCTLSLWEREL